MLHNTPSDVIITSIPITQRTVPTTVEEREQSSSIKREKQVVFEVKSNTYKRKVEVKTKQEDKILKKPAASISVAVLPAVNNVVLQSPSTSTYTHEHRRSSFSNSSAQSYKVSISSFDSFTRPRTISNASDDKTNDTYASMLENLKEDSYDDFTTAPDTSVDYYDLRRDEKFNKRPLLELISELHKHHIPQKTISNEKQEQEQLKLSQESLLLSPPEFHTAVSSTAASSSARPLSPTIVPPKQFSPFRPVIIHRKYQSPIGRFEFVDGSENISADSGGVRRNSRTGVSVIRSHTFNSNHTAPTKDLSVESTDSMQITNDADRIHHISTPELFTTLPTISRQDIAPHEHERTTEDKNEAKRKAIVMQMYDTEKSYVEALKILVTKYYLPMKDRTIISNDLVNDIFYKIPEIHMHHTAFFISLTQKLALWDNKQTIGDLLLQTFAKQSVIETYTSFVTNYKTAQEAIRLCRDSSSFNKFLEQQAKEHRGKLALRDLIIQPVQRIPRYELYTKDFLKCTNLNHPDYQLLLKAQNDIHTLAEEIDQVQREVGGSGSGNMTSGGPFNDIGSSLELVQDMIENLTDLVHPDRFYIRHDIVTLQLTSGIKKDRCIFLFNDLIIVTSCKRRSGTLSKKGGSVILNSPSGKQYIDNVKHKLIMKIPLEDVDLASGQLKKTSVATDKSHLVEDVSVLTHITELAKTISVPHQLDESIKDTMHTVNKHLVEENETDSSSDHKSVNVQLTINTSERIETIDVLFSSFDQKLSWERSFLEAKKALFDAAGRRNVIFQHVLTLPHNRAGMQFSCAAPRLSSNDAFPDVWVCNSDGLSSEVCLVNLHPDFNLKACNTVCTSKITCLAFIPAHNPKRNVGSAKRKHHPHVKHDQHSTSTEQTLGATPESLLDIDSSDDEDTYHGDTSS
ncbi:unnamed protein product, partial [Didymodactylos carnosus]